MNTPGVGAVFTKLHIVVSVLAWKPPGLDIDAFVGCQVGLL